MLSWYTVAPSLLALFVAPGGSTTLRGAHTDRDETDAFQLRRSLDWLENDMPELWGSDWGSEGAADAVEALRNVPCYDNPEKVRLETKSLKVVGCSKECYLWEVSASARKFCVGKMWDRVKCYHAIAALRERAWPHIQTLAAHLRGESYFKALNTTLSAEREPHTGTFRAGGGYAAKVECRKGGGAANLYYRHIWKDAGSAIIYNMQNLGNGLVTGGGDWSQNNRCSELMRQRANPDDGHKPVLFTFVRNPISKFVAGYKEMSYRNLIDDLRGFKVGQRQHAITFLDLVLSGSCDNGHVLLQASNLISLQCESKFDFIGRLEHFADDWKKLSGEAGCDAAIPWDDNAYHHESEDDPFGYGQAMMDVLQAEGGKLMRVLCWWMLPDFAIFDYEMPPECAMHPVLASSYVRKQ